MNRLFLFLVLSMSIFNCRMLYWMGKWKKRTSFKSAYMHKEHIFSLPPPFPLPPLPVPIPQHPNITSTTPCTTYATPAVPHHCGAPTALAPCRRPVLAPQPLPPSGLAPPNSGSIFVGAHRGWCWCIVQSTQPRCEMQKYQGGESSFLLPLWGAGGGAVVSAWLSFFVCYLCIMH